MYCPIQYTSIENISVNCKRCEYAKENRCDYPYKKGMTLEEVKKITGGSYGRKGKSDTKIIETAE